MKWKSLPRPHGVHIEKDDPRNGMIHHMKTHHLAQRKKNKPDPPPSSPFLQGGKGTNGTRARSRLAMVSSDESQFGGALKESGKRFGRLF